MRVTFPIAVAFVMALAVAPQPAMAQSSGATIAKDLPCGGFIPTASGGDSGVYIWASDSVVATKGNGSTSLSCHFIIPSGLEPTNTVRASNFACRTWLGLTYDSRMQANSGGNATLSCRVRTSSKR